MQLRFTVFERVLHRLHLLPTPVLDAFGSVLFGHCLAIGVRRGLFEFLATGVHSPAEIALHVNMSEPAVTLLLESYRAAGYLKLHSGGYALTEESSRWLLRGSPSSMTNLIGYFETLYSRWGELEYALEHGRPRRPYYEAFDEGDWRLYVYAMQDLARILLPEVFRVVKHAGSPERLLDIGGSHGRYTLEFCRRFPGLQATIMDFAPALRVAEELIRAEDMEQRIALRGGDVRTSAFPGGQDVILLFNVIHGFSENENLDLVQRSLGALRPGGVLYILDQFLEGRRSSDLSRFLPLMVGLNLLNEIGGRAYAFSDIQRWSSRARSVKYRRLRVPGVALIEVKV